MDHFGPRLWPNRLSWSYQTLLVCLKFWLGLDLICIIAFRHRTTKSPAILLLESLKYFGPTKKPFSTNVESRFQEESARPKDVADHRLVVFIFPSCYNACDYGLSLMCTCKLPPTSNVAQSPNQAEASIILTRGCCLTLVESQHL